MKKSSIALLLLSLSPLASFAATAPLDLVGPVSDYKIYVTEEIAELVTQTQAFTDAINKGDLATAKKLYAPTRVHYESIEPIAELFSDLDASIDSRVDDHEKGVKAKTSPVSTASSTACSPRTPPRVSPPWPINSTRTCWT